MSRKSELDTYIKRSRAALHSVLSIIVCKSPELFENGTSEHTAACLDEIIDDLFHTPLANAEQGDRETGEKGEADA